MSKQIEEGCRCVLIAATDPAHIGLIFTVTEYDVLDDTWKTTNKHASGEYWWADTASIRRIDDDEPTWAGIEALAKWNPLKQKKLIECN